MRKDTQNKARHPSFGSYPSLLCHFTNHAIMFCLLQPLANHAIMQRKHNTSNSEITKKPTYLFEFSNLILCEHGKNVRCGALRTSLGGFL